MNVKNLFITFVLFLSIYAAFSNIGIAQTADSLLLPREYSLYSEYHKNRDYESALPYGWNILRIDPVKYNKWIYTKMEEALWYLHDSTQRTDEEKLVIADTTLYLYNLAIEHYKADAPYFQRKRAFVIQTWYGKPKESITEYEKAIQMDSTVDSYWYNILGQLYKANMQEDPEFKTKALDLFSFLSEREPNNPVWNTELEGLVDNIDELIALAKKSWEFNKDDLAKGWKYASLCIKVNEFNEALIPLEYLTQKSPETINYNTQLALAYQKLEMFDKAVDQYNKLIKLDPKAKEHYLNLGMVYKERGQLSQARTQFQRANEVAGGWGLAVFYEGMLYEQSARGCSFDFETKVVYQLAVDTYRRAANMDPSLTAARDRVGALSASTPTKEDYFFRKIKSGTTLPISGSCFGWIGKSIVVP